MSTGYPTEVRPGPHHLVGACRQVVSPVQGYPGEAESNRLSRQSPQGLGTLQQLAEDTAGQSGSSDSGHSSSWRRTQPVRAGAGARDTPAAGGGHSRSEREQGLGTLQQLAEDTAGQSGSRELGTLQQLAEDTASWQRTQPVRAGAGTRDTPAAGGGHTPGQTQREQGHSGGGHSSSWQKLAEDTAGQSGSRDSGHSSSWRRTQPVRAGAGTRDTPAAGGGHSRSER